MLESFLNNSPTTKAELFVMLAESAQEKDRLISAMMDIQFLLEDPKHCKRARKVAIIALSPYRSL